MHFCPKARVNIFSPSSPLKNAHTLTREVPKRCSFPVAEKTNLPILHDSDISEHNLLNDSPSLFQIFWNVSKVVISRRAETRISNYPQLLKVFASLMQQKTANSI